MILKYSRLLNGIAMLLFLNAASLSAHRAAAQPPARPSPIAVHSTSTAADATATLRRMVAAYKALRSMSMTTEAEQVISFNRTVNNRQVTTLSYQQQPARLAKRTSDPIQGVTDYIANGTKLAVYNSSSHIHAVRSTQPTITSICQAVDAESPQILNPVSFLTEADMPSYLIRPQSKPSETVNGRAALVVRCEFKPEFLTRLGSRLKLPSGFKPFQSRATLWIDPQTFFLLKSDIRLGWRGTVKTNGQVRQVTPTIDGTERVTQMQANPILDQAQFQLHSGD